MAAAPVPPKRLEQIARDACNKALESAQYYEHAKTEQWNQTIIDSMLRDLIGESKAEGQNPTYKWAVNSTIVQHVVPDTQVGKSGGSEEKSAGEKGLAGRRGMHSAMRAFWNEKTDGMWSFKYDGENKGLDVVIMVIWVAI